MGETVVAVLAVVAFATLVVNFVASAWLARAPCEERRAARRPRLSARRPPPTCPFCGHAMRPGRVYTLTGLPTLWQPDDAPPRPRRTNRYTYAIPRGERLVLGLSNRATRGASLCMTCDAVVIDPRAPAG